MGSPKLKAVRDASQTERERPLRADMEANQEYCIHGYSLSRLAHLGKPIGLFAVSCSQISFS